MDLVDLVDQVGTECMVDIMEGTEFTPAHIIDLIWRHDIITEEW
jgi:hypothetical protein